MATGMSGAPVSAAGCNSEPKKRRTWRPSLVVPSGNMATQSPAASAAASCRFSMAVWWRRWRWMNRVPTFSASQPMSGQARTSDLATKRQARWLSMSQMSSQEMWLATNTTPRACAGSVPLS